LLATSLLCLVLVLAFLIAGPALVVAIFSAVVILVPFVPFPRASEPVPVAARRRSSSPRAPPVF
jgi:hypothetical protein